MQLPDWTYDLVLVALAYLLGALGPGFFLANGRISLLMSMSRAWAATPAWPGRARTACLGVSKRHGGAG